MQACVCVCACVCVHVCSDTVPAHMSKYQPVIHLLCTVYTSDVDPAPYPVDPTARYSDDGAGPPGQQAARQPNASIRTQNIKSHVAPSTATAASPGPPPGFWPADPPPAYPGTGPVYLAQPMRTPVAVVGMDW